MKVSEWASFGVFALGVYALSFFSMNAALFLLVTVGIAAFVARSNKQVSAPSTGTGGTAPKG